MFDRFERECFHSELPKTWKIPNKSQTSLIKSNETHTNTSQINNKRNKTKYEIPYDQIVSLVFFIIRISFMAFSVYIVLKIFFSLKNDIRIRIDEEYAKLMYLIQDSKYKFMINKCDLVDIPGIKKDCMRWKSIMSKTKNDIQVMGIAMDCLGHILDRFLEQISWKLFITISCFIFIYIIFYRKK